MRYVTIAMLLGVMLTACSDESRIAKSEQSKTQVYIISPLDGATVSSPVLVTFGLRDFGVAPAGLQKENTGHHHLLIDMQELPPLDRPLPSTDQVRHFGGGQTQVELTLTPGQHRLQLLLGDFAHRPHNPPLLSAPITITVQ